MAYMTSQSGRRRVAKTFDEYTRTKQAFREECDINQIMKKFETTGELPNMIKQNPQYGDFANVPDYQTALNMVQHAHSQFSALSAQIRNRFHNDPSKFLAFCNDPRNKQELIDLGLAERPAPVVDKKGSVKEKAPAEGQGAKKDE